jgi:effector-binding domain-containing protein
MPAYHVQRSIEIPKDIDTVRTSLCDFKQWPHWSPWLISEPAVKLRYSDQQGSVGAGYDWEGEMIGAGDLSLQRMTENELEMQLNFRRPFKSKAKVVFELESVGDDATNVSWNLYGKMPFFLFFMTKMMKAYIGMDYERGLKMLKEYLETGDVASTLTLEGIVEWGEGNYIGINNECTFDDIGDVMSADFGKLYECLQLQEQTTDKPPFTIYNEFDPVKRFTRYVVGAPVDQTVKATDGFIRDGSPVQKYLKVTHMGHYEHLGNAWATASAYARAKKIKIKGKPLGVEIYLNDPATTPSEALVTEVLLAIK